MDSAIPIRTSCSRQLIVELAGALGLTDTSNPDNVLRAAIEAAARLKGLEK